MVIEPYGNDQFYNARQVVTLEIGAAMHPHRLSSAGLARVLHEKVLQPECRARVKAIGAVLRAEDGLALRMRPAGTVDEESIPGLTN